MNTEHSTNTVIFTDLSEWLQTRKKIKGSIGFVATMGNLHAGHLSLLERAKAENDYCILSIFVNPTQFNDKNDFTHYPRSLEADLALARSVHTDYVIIPTEQQLYPMGYRYRVSEHELSDLMEGEHRPGHFTGMLTVVLKLLQLIKPQRAYFGEKDYQQYQLIQRMAQDFFLDIDVVGLPTVRETSGLAMSSRNQRLSASGRQLASEFYHALNSKLDSDAVKNKLKALGFQVDYIQDHEGRRFGAVFLEGVRLIDNIKI